MANTATSFLSGLEGRFEFGLYSNLNLPRGSGSGILPNLIPEPLVRNWVWKVWEPDCSQSTVCSYHHEWCEV